MKVPCKQCPVLAMCITKEHCRCYLTDKYMKPSLDPITFDIRSLEIYYDLLHSVQDVVKKKWHIRHGSRFLFHNVSKWV